MIKRIVLSLVALVLCVTLLTSCGFYLPSNNPGTSTSGNSTSGLIGAILDQYSYYDYDITDEELSRALVFAYQMSTGDIYTTYYNAEEYARLNENNEGETQGIGITIIENTDYNCIEVISVFPDSPAMKAGVLPGDFIVYVGVGEDAEPVSELGYELALKQLQGVKDTVCSFGLVHPEDTETVIDFNITRSEFTSQSVTHYNCAADSTVGIVKISNFDLTTPQQFRQSMNSLIADGCTSFVYDVRSNPGGDLASVRAVLSYFLNPGDVVIITEDNKKNTETVLCEPISYNGAYTSCNVTAEDIGIYRNYPSAVIINKNSASAAELFTGSLKSYEISTIVGETSFGKGCMQSIFPLSNFGSQYSGAIRLTTKYYRPYGMENYHGIGIEPSEGYMVELSENASKINLYKLLESNNQQLDNQLSAAISAIKK